MKVSTIVDDFICLPVSPRVCRIFDIAQCVMTLIEGDEKALLVDTGTGYGNIREAVEKMTDKPVEVFITHGHGDHIGGSYLWDFVYIHPADVPMYAGDSAASRANSIGSMMKQRMYAEPTDYSRMVESRPIELKPTQDGDVFDLGGVVLKVVGMPGHTPGSIGLLNEKDRYLVSGDAVCRGTLVVGEGMEPLVAYRDMLKDFIAKYRDKIDYVLESHGPSPDQASILEGTLDAVDGVVTGRYPGYPDYRFGPHLGVWTFPDTGTKAVMYRAKPESEVEAFCSDGMLGNITWFKEIDA